MGQTSKGVLLVEGEVGGGGGGGENEENVSSRGCTGTRPITSKTREANAMFTLTTHALEETAIIKTIITVAIC